jgi:hypothetical protein
MIIARTVHCRKGIAASLAGSGKRQERALRRKTSLNLAMTELGKSSPFDGAIREK